MDDELIADITNDELVAVIEEDDVLTVNPIYAEALTAVIEEDDVLAGIEIDEVERFGYLEISEDNDRLYFMYEDKMIVYYINGPQPLGEVPYRIITPGPGEPVIINCKVDYGLVIDARGLSGRHLSIDVVNWPVNALGIVHLVVKMPSADLSIGWPDAACPPMPVYGYDLTCEFELRSWDNGQTVTVRLVSLSPTKD